MPARRPRRSARRFGASVLVTMALVAGGCGDSTDSGQTSAASEVQSDQGVARTADGGQIEWASLEGTDTVLWFWAPW